MRQRFAKKKNEAKREKKWKTKEGIRDEEKNRKGKINLYAQCKSYQTIQQRRMGTEIKRKRKYIKEQKEQRSQQGDKIKNEGMKENRKRQNDKGKRNRNK